MSSALEDEDSSVIVNTYKQCIIKAATNVGLQVKCYDALLLFGNISLHKKDLEVLTNKFNGTKYDRFISLHYNVVQPAFIKSREYFYCNDFAFILH